MVFNRRYFEASVSFDFCYFSFPISLPCTIDFVDMRVKFDSLSLNVDGDVSEPDE